VWKGDHEILLVENHIWDLFAEPSDIHPCNVFDLVTGRTHKGIPAGWTFTLITDGPPDHVHDGMEGFAATTMGDNAPEPLLPKEKRFELLARF
jgi:hypothetical protein